MTIPILHSRPGATNVIYLAFDGWSGPQFGVSGSPVINSPPFASPEWIPDIHAAVKANWSQLNIDFTTERPISGKYGVCAIGGSWSDWSGQQQSGVTFSPQLVGWNFGALTNYVFPLGGELTTPTQVANCISHECGHLFGLLHQFSGGTYRSNAIMGNFYSEPAAWVSGTNEYGQAQDDIAILTSGLGAAPMPANPDSMILTLNGVTKTYLLTEQGGGAAEINAPTSDTLTAPDGSVWSFGGAIGSDFAILRNGVAAAGGYAVKIKLSAGSVYVRNASGIWYKWNGSGWDASGQP